ncbi:amidase family protein [Nocardia seriolae]|uniref:Amidase n=1 Tax=Nocardia seriolae TaxID=37332 RepID=A0ABC8AXT6_9NOCA|nr:amidase family protein [Nocardia seriolae]APA99013.1 Amidase [Nocardia seriolae]OJF80783.1 hypothetical protein NS14008_18180 [Nocardia seriolae]PSK31940.1 hypothetical protein C6575_07390 [Nocardia seriolae]QOW35268.1 hypothetical protein IMZ23_10085 [Nocardia seriolae]QUN17267.1 hypothetical protein KEC46_34920 [Nocardia seriolae]
MEWGYLAAEELSTAMRAGDITSVELTQDAIARIERDDKTINAICVPDFDRARTATRTTAGAHLRRHSPLLPDLAEAADLYARLLVGNLIARMPADRYEQLRTAARNIEGATGFQAAWLRGAIQTQRQWSEATTARELHRHAWRQLFTEFDAVICPITPTPAFPHDHRDLTQRHIDIDGVAHPFGDQLAWAGVATMPGLPATAIPAGRSPEGLPVGVQIIGPMLEDRTPLRLAELLEATLGGFQVPE